MKHARMVSATVVLASTCASALAQSGTTPPDPDEIRAIVTEMIADAESRSSFLQSDATVGHNGHFYLSSPDGSFRLKLAGQVQFRYLLNFRDSSAADDFNPGFQNRRTKLAFSGHLFEDIQYKVNGAHSRATGTFRLEDAYVRMPIGEQWKMRFGQFKEGFLREELVSSKKQLLVDRSVTNELYNQGRSQGIEFEYKDDQWRFTASFSDGFRSANTDFGSVLEADWSLTGRAELLLSGNWKQFKDFTSGRGSDEALMIGAAAHYEVADRVLVGSDEAKTLAYTADISWENDGWNAFASFAGRNIQDALGVSGADLDTFGLVFQGGVYVSDDWEVFARYDEFFNDSAIGDDFATVTFGANNYIHGHAAKFSVDVQWHLDDFAGTFGAVGPSTGLGTLGGAGENEVVIRAQFQLLF